MKKDRRQFFMVFIMCVFMICSFTLGQKSVSPQIIVKEKVIHDTIPYIDSVDYAEYPYKISDSGIEHIKSYEKCKLNVYTINGHKTIGWGHLLKRGENYTSISQAKADQLFKLDIKIHEDAMNRLLEPFEGKFKFTQGFVDAFGSLVYNCGEGGVKRTEFYKRLTRSRVDNKTGNIKESDYNFTISAVKTANVTMKGHIKRRQAEYEMMLI